VLEAASYEESSARNGPQGSVPLPIAVASDTGAITKAQRSFEGLLAFSLGVLALVLLLAAWVFVRCGLRPFDRLRTDLAAIHEGRVARLSGRYPDEVQPLVGDLNELLLRQEDIAAKARARAADLAHGLKTPPAVLDALVANAREVGQSSIECTRSLDIDKTCLYDAGAVPGADKSAGRR
jgi:signal transduction histidine kinase